MIPRRAEGLRGLRALIISWPLIFNRLFFRALKEISHRLDGRQADRALATRVTCECEGMPLGFRAEFAFGEKPEELNGRGASSVAPSALST